VVNTILQPKAEYFDELVERHLLTNFRDTAKELKIGQKAFIGFLLDNARLHKQGQEKAL
jgi:anti-repressor protein